MIVVFSSASLSRTNSRSNKDIVLPVKEPSVLPPGTSDEENENSIIDPTTSYNILDELGQNLSSSESELDLSVALLSQQTASSLSLTDVDTHQDMSTDENDTLSLTPTCSISDNESVLYSRLSKELDMNSAMLDSDLDKLGR